MWGANLLIRSAHYQHTKIIQLISKDGNKQIEQAMLLCPHIGKQILVYNNIIIIYDCSYSQNE